MMPIHDSLGRMARGLGTLALALAATLCLGCGDDDSSGGDAGTDTDADSDADGGADAGEDYSAQILWAKRSGGERSDEVTSVVALSDNSLVTTGWFEWTTVFGEEE